LTLLKEGGRGALWPLVVGLLVAVSGTALEAVLMRGVFEMARMLKLPVQRLTALGALGLFALGLLLVELPIAAGVRRLGRCLEVLLRVRFLQKLPQMGDRYFQSRPTSDMAHRSHDVYRLRSLVEIVGRLARAGGSLLATAVGLVWLVPSSIIQVMVLAVSIVMLPLVALPQLIQADMRLRTHTGALSRFYLDGLLGLTAVRTHGAERSVRREHEGLLVHWVQASRRFHAGVAALEGVCALVGFGLAVWLLADHLSQGRDAGTALLLIYWALMLPVLGRELMSAAIELPALRNTTLRLLEPLMTPVAADAKRPTPAEAWADAEPRRGVSLDMRGVSVRVAGHTVLEDIHLSIAPGEQVAVVGLSGAGKSSLLGLLLGWYPVAQGELRVDGTVLTGDRVEWLRGRTAWVDPSVQLWNRSVLENLEYGAPERGVPELGGLLEQAELLELLEKLPDGLQTRLGEGGGLVSGGEGQRVRFGRALQRAQAWLAILDEPFRGLDRARRRELLRRARKLWQGSTLLCATHDVGETREFERVLVIEDGRLIEDGAPAVLAARDSRYAALLAAEQVVQTRLWDGEGWRRMRLEGGRLEEFERPVRQGRRGSG
jgi:ABC-type transport system involved in cytochrome bd biosynthesis fused ATPase/permease subunit